MSRVVIVSRTKMAEGRVCVGGIDAENSSPVRLLDETGCHEYLSDCPYEIGELWNIEYIRDHRRDAPHTEDVKVINRSRIGPIPISMIEALNRTTTKIYKGSLRDTFEGCLQYTSSGSMYINNDNVPTHSTCFWLSDRDLYRDDFNNKIRYKYKDGTLRYGFSMPYVGLESPCEVIPKGTLIRLSLAHWWSPADSDQEERCYLQLSGWYD